MQEKWDVHTHTTLAPDTYDALGKFSRYADFVRVRAAAKPCCAEMVNGRGEVQRLIEENAYDGAARLKECDKHGVTMQVLSPTPMMIPDYVDNFSDAAEICKIVNDGNAALASGFPKRFTALAALPMRDAALAVKELERARSLGMRGAEINSNINGVDLDDPRFFPVFEAASELGMAVFIHPWGGFMSPAEERLKKRMTADYNWRPWLIAMGFETALAFDALRGVHEKLPKLRVLYAHGGGVFPSLLGRMQHGADVRPDLMRHKGRNLYALVRDCGVYTDALTHDAAVLEMLIRLLGAHRIAMGSDYPYPLGEMDPTGKTGIYPGHMVEHLASLSDKDRQRILSGTAKEWLGL